MAEWVPRVTRLAAHTKSTYIAFNNHYGGQAVVNARRFRSMLRDAGLDVQ